MTVNEVKIKIENALAEIASDFGNAQHLVKYDIQVSENEIDGAPVDITYVFGSLSLGKDGDSEDDRLYLPLDAELDDNDNVDEAKFEENLAAFKARVLPIKERLATSEDPEAELTAIIEEFDRDLEEKYMQEIEQINRAAKKNLIRAGIMAAVMVVIAVIVMVIDKIG